MNGREIPGRIGRGRQHPAGRRVGGPAGVGRRARAAGVGRRADPGRGVQTVPRRRRPLDPGRRHRRTHPVPAGGALVLDLPTAPAPASLDAYRLDQVTGTTATPHDPTSTATGGTDDHHHDQQRAGRAAGATRAARGPGRRTTATQARRDPPGRPGSAADRQDSTVDTARAAPRPGRGRGHRPRRVQRRRPTQGSDVSRGQDPRRVRHRRVLDPAETRSTT